MNTKSKHKLLLLAILGSFPALCLDIATAQVAQSVTSMTTEAPIGIPKLVTTIAIDYESQIAKEANQERPVDLNLTLSPKYSLTPKTAITAKTIVTQHQINDKSSSGYESEMSDTVIGVTTQGLELAGPTQIVHGLSGILPTNKTSATVDRFKGGIRLNNGFDTQWGFLAMSYRLGIQRNVHEYTINAIGSPNIEWALRNYLEFSYEFTEKFSAKFVGLYIQGRTYGGFEKADFTSDLSVEYDLTPSFHLTGGLSNKGSALAANGLDSNLKFYNDKSSTWSVGIEVVF